MFKKDIQYYRFCAYGFLKNLRFFEPFLIIILHHEGLSFTQIGVLYAIREIFRNILEIPAGVFADAFGRRKSMVLVLGLASGFFVHLDLLLPALILFAGIYLVQNVRKPIGIGKVADNIDPKILASALSAESQAETIFAAIFVLILGIFTDLLGLGMGILILSLLVFLTGLLVSHFLTRKSLSRT